MPEIECLLEAICLNDVLKHLNDNRFYAPAPDFKGEAKQPNELEEHSDRT